LKSQVEELTNELQRRIEGLIFKGGKAVIKRGTTELHFEARLLRKFPTKSYEKYRLNVYGFLTGVPVSGFIIVQMHKKLRCYGAYGIVTLDRIENMMSAEDFIKFVGLTAEDLYKIALVIHASFHMW